jgi:LysR family nitrogen assimilation transcriptional regulator
MELEALRLFLVVAEQESFTRAAIKLGITQPALSRHVQRLEQEFDTLLLYRHGRGVRLTEAGQKLRVSAEGIFQTLKDTKEELSADNSKFRGTVTLGLPPSIGATVSVHLARRFQEAYPEAQLRIVVGFSGTLLEWLEAGRIDVGVLYDARRSRTLLVTPLLREDLYLIESPAKPCAATHAEVSELAEGFFVVPGPPNGMRRVVDNALARANLKMQITAEIDCVHALRELAEAGPERCILPFGAVHHQVNEGRLRARRFRDPDMQALLVLATPLHRPVSKLASAVLRLVVEEVKRCLDEGVLTGISGPGLRQDLAVSSASDDVEFLDGAALAETVGV